MKTKVIKTILVILILCGVNPAQAATVWDINEDTDIYSGFYPLINIYDTPQDHTTVNMYGGTSFMEDYTYHLEPRNMKVLGAHMLEVCETIAKGKCSLEVHPLSIGGKADPARLVFNVPNGAGINASVIDLGNRFRMIVNEVDVVAPDEPLPKLPVARVVWVPKPNLKTGAAAWILAGGAHHTGFSMAVTAEHMEDFAEMAGMEYVLIGKDTKISEFKKELRWNEIYYHLAKGL